MSSATPPSTAGEMLQRSREFLARKGVEEARLEAELLVAHALGLDRLRLYMQLDRPLTPAEIDRARDLLVLRGKRMPLAYIRGAREFYGRSFSVGPGVLIPRPETELIVDLARALPALRVADLGTGSGCLAVTLALELPQAEVFALENSAAAALCSGTNIARLASRVQLIEGDGFESLERLAREGGPFDLIVSNPPYIERSEAGQLAPEVREHEPHAALFAPEDDPDHFARRLLECCTRRDSPVLAPGGSLLVELGHKQAPRLRTLAQQMNLEVQLVRDGAGIERVLSYRR
ncbi:MAG: peptide chain release factor N(5)-glutamine methyltransferase [Planctomycetia bacterium]